MRTMVAKDRRNGCNRSSFRRRRHRSNSLLRRRLCDPNPCHRRLLGLGLRHNRSYRRVRP